MTTTDELVDAFMDDVRAASPGQDEFHQAVREVASDVLTLEKGHTDTTDARVLERLTVPDRMITFRVVWHDDAGRTQINRGYRVQQCNVLGPYKGGLRFHPTVRPSVLKFLAFEQTFKNALTGLPLGGAKGGSDFDPRGRSDREIMRFCTAFMMELAHHIGPGRDVPAGDINVGSREIGWLFGAYKSIAGRFEGALTGKGQTFGGSALRVEATGYGLLYFVQEMLREVDRDLTGLRVAISGKGNVATYAAEKARQLGGTVITLSDTRGTLEAPEGLTPELLSWVAKRKAAGQDIADPPHGARFHVGRKPWSFDCDVALPCATQNELDDDDASRLVEQGCQLIAEGANMPLTAEATDRIRNSDVLYAPGKATNAGGVAVSGLEMSQNAQGMYWDRERVDQELRAIMKHIHRRCREEGRVDGAIDYARGANRAAYRTLSTALVALGTASG